MADEYFNPLLMDANSEDGGDNTFEKNFVVVAKGDDDKKYYVLSKSMQNTLAEYEKGDKQINTKGNPVIDKYEKFTAGGKEYYGVNTDDYGAVSSGDIKWFDSYKWVFDKNTKEAKYYKGETDLARLYDNMDVPDKYKDFTKKEDNIEQSEYGYDEIPF